MRPRAGPIRIRGHAIDARVPCIGARRLESRTVARLTGCTCISTRRCPPWRSARHGAVRLRHCAPRWRRSSLELLVDGEPQPVTAHGMPRLDDRCARSAAASPTATAAASGASRAVAPAPRARCELVLRAELEGGGTADAALGRHPGRAAARARRAVARRRRRRAARGDLHGDLRAAAGPASRASSSRSARRRHRNWVCVISDDCSDPERFAAIEADARRRPALRRLALARRLGFYRNFERALALAPAAARLRRDGRPGRRLAPRQARDAAGRARRRPARLQRRRIVDRDGELIADTYWEQRRNNHTDLLSLLVANCRHRRGLAVPARRCSTTRCPSRRLSSRTSTTTGSALTALALGDIAFVDRPLYDYVQHGDAVARPRGGQPDARPCATGSRRLRRDPRERVRLWRMHYFVDVCRLMQFATVLRMRCGDRMTPPSGGRSSGSWPPTARCRRSRRLWARGACASSLRRRPETLGRRDGRSRYAFAWRRAVAATAGERPRGLLRLDARAPARAWPRARAGADPRARARGRRREDRAARAGGARRRAAAGQPAHPHHRPRPLLRGLHREVQSRPAAGRARRCGCGSSPSTRSAPLPRDWKQRAGVLQRARRACSTASRWRSAASARASRSAARTASSPPRGGARTSRTHAVRALGRRALPLPDPGVRAVHVPDGHLRGAGERVLRLPARRAVLDGAAARLLPPPRDRRLRGRRRRGRSRIGRVRERDHRHRPAHRRRSWRGARRAGCCSTRARSPTPRATCSSSACSRSTVRSSRARSARLGAARHRRPSTAAGASTSGGGARLDLLAAHRPARLRGACCATTTSASR